MNEENTSQELEDDDAFSFMHNKLKDVDVKTIEQALAKTMSELVGVDYKCTVDEISYGDYRSHGGKFKVNIWEKIKL